MNDSALALGVQVMRAVLQAVSVVVLARALGASAYGIVAGNLALLITFAQLVGLGSGLLLVRAISRGELAEDAAYAGAFRSHALTGLLVAAIAWSIARIALPGGISPLALAMLAITECVLAPMVLPLGFRLQAAGRLARSSTVTLSPAIARALSAAAMLAFASASVATYSALYVGIMSIVVAITLRVSSGVPRGWLKRPAWKLAESAKYAVSSWISVGSSELDKAATLRSLGAEATARYAAGFRFMQIALLPAGVLVQRHAPALFRSHDTAEYERHFRRLLAMTAGYGAVASVVIWLVAPVAPLLFGASFPDIGYVVRCLAPYVLVNCLRQSFVAALTTSNLQWARNLVEAMIVVGVLIGITLYARSGLISTVAVVLLLAELGGVLAAALLLRIWPRPSSAAA